MKSNSVIDLPADYALVLQQVREHGEDEFAVLAETLNIRRSRLAHIIGSLRKKGLVMIERTNVGDAWIRLSHKGQKLMTQIWPEQVGAYA